MASEVDWSVWAWEHTAIGRQHATQQGLHEGDEVLSIGFPIGWTTQSGGQAFDVNYPLVRGGVIAQIRGWLRGNHDTFLVDCPLFDGNSGGPIVTVPSAFHIDGSQPQRQGWLVGVATAKLSGDVMATGHTPLDLGIVTPLDSVNAAIQTAMAAER